MTKRLSKNLIGAAAVALTLSACSTEDVTINEAKATSEIAFNVTANSGTRAETYYNASTDIMKFKVSAWANAAASGTTVGVGKAYFTTENLTYNGTAWTYDDQNVRYWPNNGETLDFYAWVDHAKGTTTTGEGDDAVTTATYTTKGYSFDWNSGRPMLKNIEQKDAAEMVDLLYANTFGASQTAHAVSEKVNLTFNHALSQIGVTVKVDNPKIQIEVAEVSLVNLAGKADFSFATAATGDDAKAKWTVAEGTTTVTPVAKISPAQKVTYVAEKAAEGENPAVVNNGVNLTADDNTFMVIPATGYTQANGGNNIKTENGETTVAAGTCIGIKCKIWNVADANGVANDDLLIYGTADSYKYLFVPVTLNTNMGTKYNYTISFGKGNAGLDENGNNTTVKMDWNVTLTDWTEENPNLEN